MNCSPPGSSVHGILQARILGWAAIPNPEIKPRSPTLKENSLLSEPPGKPYGINDLQKMTELPKVHFNL